MDRTIVLWAMLPLESIARWRAYADAPSPLPLPPGAERARRRASGYAVFRGLAAKYMHVHGGFDAPTEPPATPFLGDGIVVGVSGPLPQPPRQDEPLGEGASLVFTPSGRTRKGC